MAGLADTVLKKRNGQSLVEFALILPLFVLFIIGIFELGRAFFAFIAITNAAREGARVVTFWPGKTVVNDVIIAVTDEIGTSPMVTVDKIADIKIECGDGSGGYIYINDGLNGDDDANLKACLSEQPVKVTVTYKFDFILNFFSSKELLLKRSAEMMVP